MVQTRGRKKKEEVEKKVKKKSTRKKSPKRSTKKKTQEDVKRIPFEPHATYADDLKVLYSMWFASIDTSGSHQNKLESFYGHQAVLYDKFRHRMLHGRNPMLMKMHAPANGVWVDLGAGTASNLEYFSSNIKHFKRICVVDLCPSLAKVAQQRVDENKWGKTVKVLLGDATDTKLKGLPRAGTVDVVTISYALTMIPDWKACIANAKRLLKKGGHLCVCDFTVLPEQGQSSFSQWLFKFVFSHDHVFLRKEHHDTLRNDPDLSQVRFETGYGGFPYVPGVFQSGFYVYEGVKN
eukprot:g3957.t1